MAFLGLGATIIIHKDDVSFYSNKTHVSFDTFLEFLWDESGFNKNIFNDDINNWLTKLTINSKSKELINRKIKIFKDKMKSIKRKESRQRIKEKKRQEQSKIKTFIRITRPQPGKNFQVKKVWDKLEESEEKESEEKEDEWEEEILFQIK